MRLTALFAGFFLFVSLNAQYIITTVAGGGSPNGLLATNIGIGEAYGVKRDALGNTYINAHDQNRVYKVDPAGIITVLAGNGALGFSGDGGPATAATLGLPYDVALDGAGNVFIADGCRIRKVTGGIISTALGQGGCSSTPDSVLANNANVYPTKLAFDQSGNLYFSEYNSNRVRKLSGGVVSTVVGNGTAGYSGDGGPAVAASLNGPEGIAFDANGRLYIADYNNNRVRMVADGVITTVAGNGASGSFGDGGLAINALLNEITEVAFDKTGNLYIASGGRVREVVNGIIQTVAGNDGTQFSGDGGPAASAGFSAEAIFVDNSGLYIADSLGDRVRRVSGGIIQTFAGNGTGNYFGDGIAATSAGLSSPGGVAVDTNGNLYVADVGNGRIRKVTNGIISTVATFQLPSSNPPVSNMIVADGSGRVYFIDGVLVRMIDKGNVTIAAGNGTSAFSGDNGPATSAGIDPIAIAVTSAGDLYIADRSSRIRKVSQGVITTIAGDGTCCAPQKGDGGRAQFASFTIIYSLAEDGLGNLYVGDYRSIRKISNGIITTVANLSDTYSDPIFADRSGNAYLISNGKVSVLNGPAIGSVISADGTPATFAAAALAFDGTGKIYIADATNNRIRALVPTASAAPFGSFDTPTDHATGIAGTIAVTGWALDEIQVSSVGIWRDPVGTEPVSTNGLVFIGNANFVTGARPDIQNAHPSLPFSDRAGWGYLLLTNSLPAGNGTFKLHAIANNQAGLTTELGVKTITVDNAHATKPFGNIDTPDQGGTAAGGQFINFGWALTPLPQCIPIDGSSITVTVDGVPLGHPVYNQPRADIIAAFPGYCNTNGAVGYFMLDATKLTNGVHTIGWVVYDNIGRGDGVGSRFFTVSNGTSNAPAAIVPTTEESVRLRRGFNAELHPLAADRTGAYTIAIDELDRIELHVGATEGYSIVNGARHDLPIGSTLQSGTFYWQLGPGFLNIHTLEFVRADSTTFTVHVNIRPKQFLN